MAPVLERLPHQARVVLMRLRSMGDCVLTTPAIALLHRARPDLEMAMIVEPRFRAVFAGNPALAHLFDPDVQALRRFRPELCVNLHGGTRSAWMTALCGARWRAGFAHYPFQAVYNVRMPRAQQVLGEERVVHTAEHVASAMFYLGVPRAEIPRAQLFTEERPETGTYAVIHPFASHPDKSWPVEHFAAVARRLEMRTIVLAGPGDDAAMFPDAQVYANAPLETVKGVLKGAALFVGNDSGPAHLAAAFGVPVVALFGPTEPAIWGPWRTASRVLRWPGATVDRVCAAAAELQVRV
jgi:ADP-heptose:LPS heptosyltransferase